MIDQCQRCGDLTTLAEGRDMCSDCVVKYADWLERVARGDCHCCLVTPDTRPGPNGGHWHPEYLKDD